MATKIKTVAAYGDKSDWVRIGMIEMLYILIWGD